LTDEEVTGVDFQLDEDILLLKEMSETLSKKRLTRLPSKLKLMIKFHNISLRCRRN